MTPDEGAQPEHEPDAGPTSSRVEPGPPPAKEQRSRWPGWIWAIPIAALAIVAWLGFKEFAATGPLLKVTFDDAGGMQAGSTQVQYQGMKVGEVESLHLQKDLKHVDASIRMNGDMQGHLGKGTEFWIEGAQPSLANLASLKSIISGPTIGILPQPGPRQDRYQALAQPPVVPQMVPGRHFVLHADTLGTVSRGSSVYFGDLEVGSVESTTLQPDRSFDVAIFIKAPYEKLVHTGTRFWNAGAAELSMQGNGPKLQLQSPAALLQGAVDFETPKGPLEGPEAPDHQQFKLYGSKDAAQYAPGPQAVSYRVVFDASGGGLDAGAGVDLAGKRVGTVQDSTLEYDSRSGKLSERVTIAIEPSQIALTGTAAWGSDARQPMNALMDKLIGQGLRAQLGSSVPLVGAKDVELAFVQGAGQATLIPGDPPEIPTQSGGGGIQGVMTAVNSIAGKIQSLPLDQIGENIRTITARIAELSKSPQITETLDNLDRSVANVESLTATADKQVPQIITELRHVASQAEQTIAAARGVLSNQSGVTATGVDTAGLAQTLYELSQAARAVRQLADMLERNPAALIRGKG
ncbi:MAG TPA: MlaD family protein [Acetobacteraceae bacterium]|nr:MlaD family protein [Acetobacteraceae bacterium]